MTKEKLNSKRKIIQYILIGGLVLGIIASGLRLTIALFGVASVPVIMNAVPTTAQSTPSLISSLAPFIFIISPYILALGAFSAFLYVYLFRDKESRGVLIGWGILLALHLLASRYFFWL